jgi:hypothetical protein
MSAFSKYTAWMRTTGVVSLRLRQEGVMLFSRVEDRLAFERSSKVLLLLNAERENYLLYLEFS